MKAKIHIKYVAIFFALSSLLFSCSKEEMIIEQPDPYITGFVNEINSDSIEKNVQWLEDMGSRFALANNRKEVATSIKNRFIQYGYTNTILDSFYITKTYMSVIYNTWQYNVIATLEGTENPDSICIIGGHYDSITWSSNDFSNAPGANDNASGTAATLEVSRVIRKKEFSPKTTIQFIAFGAEELGLLGSYDYANKTYNSQKKIKMMLNNDMLAYWPANQKNMRVNILDYPNSTKLRLNAEKACQLYTTLETNNDNKYQAASDSYPFYLKGYKAVFFFTDAKDPNYHSTNDLVSNCNFEYCREITKVSCALLIESNK